MIDIDHGGISLAQFVAQVICLFERVEAGTLGGIHGVQRFKPHRDTDTQSVASRTASASRTPARCPARSFDPSGRPPTTMTTQGLPISAA